MTPPMQTMLHKPTTQPIDAYSRDDDPIYSTVTPVNDFFSPASEATLAPSPPERTPFNGYAKETEEESRATGYVTTDIVRRATPRSLLSSSTIEECSEHRKKADLARLPTNDKVRDPTATTSTSNDRKYPSAPGTAVESNLVEDPPSGGVTGVDDVSLEQRYVIIHIR